MDANKLKVLKEISYTFKETCASCEYSTFPSDDFGTCSLFTYKHQKHTGDERQLSINKSGGCPRYVKAKEKVSKFFENLLDS